MKSVAPLPKITAWWWLLPPVKWALERHRTAKHHRAYFAALTLEDLTALLSYVNKARGWLLVACGALLLAVKETYGFARAHQWSVATFVAISLGVSLFSVIVVVVVPIATSERTLADKRNALKQG